MKTLILALLLSGCAALNPYAYSGVMTPAECKAECESRGYQTLGVRDGACFCDPRTCIRPKHHGGCEPLPVRQEAPPTTPRM